MYHQPKPPGVCGTHGAVNAIRMGETISPSTTATAPTTHGQTGRRRRPPTSTNTTTRAIAATAPPRPQVQPGRHGRVAQVGNRRAFALEDDVRLLALEVGRNAGLDLRLQQGKSEVQQRRQEQGQRQDGAAQDPRPGQGPAADVVQYEGGDDQRDRPEDGRRRPNAEPKGHGQVVQINPGRRLVGPQHLRSQYEKPVHQGGRRQHDQQHQAHGGVGQGADPGRLVGPRRVLLDSLSSSIRRRTPVGGSFANPNLGEHRSPHHVTPRPAAAAPGRRSPSHLPSGGS